MIFCDCRSGSMELIITPYLNVFPIKIPAADSIARHGHGTAVAIIIGHPALRFLYLLLLMDS